ncbi:DNA alkylation repair protein [Clostridium sp. CF012]|uniref:DNA alkylation repair protein n=1 Tax=Clostridium sp. CF012 TaxID=2843319 RepID=UPI001C0BA3F9|nr:DNA alkylation repair protein [Clostridium sp. CF012]MBU3146858.1 DNA alkylation repair protein [Clostridium sp. CF012]
MELNEIMDELKSLGKERTKKIYMSNGAKEPVFGVSISAMKPIFKKIKYNQSLAEQLYETGNYDAMYLAGMIAEPKKMVEEDFNRWIDGAYFYMISDFIVAVTLAETDIAFSVADSWIDSGKELTMSAGWSCYDWLLGTRKDSEFDKDKLLAMLNRVRDTIHNQPNRVKYAMNNFIISVGISYLPLHEEAKKIAEELGKVEVFMDKKLYQTNVAIEYIQNGVDKGKLGFKRKHVRC